MLKLTVFLVKLIFTLLVYLIMGGFCSVLAFVFWDRSFIDIPELIEDKIWEIEE